MYKPARVTRAMDTLRPFTGLYDGPVHWRRTLDLVTRGGASDSKRPTKPDVVLVPPRKVPDDWGSSFPSERAVQLGKRVRDVEVHCATSPVQACLFRAHLQLHPGDAFLLLQHHVQRITRAPRDKPLQDSVLLCLHAAAACADYLQGNNDPMQWRRQVAYEYGIGRHTDPAVTDAAREQKEGGGRSKDWSTRASRPVFAFGLVVAELASLFPSDVTRLAYDSRAALDELRGKRCIVCGTTYDPDESLGAIDGDDGREYRETAVVARRELQTLGTYLNDRLSHGVRVGLLCTNREKHAPFVRLQAVERQGILPW